MDIKFISRINRGSFGVVDLVQVDGVELARKTFEPINKDIDEETLSKYRKRFIRETLTQEKLPSDLFLPILYKEINIDSPWFIMPYAEKDFAKEIFDYRHKEIHPEGLADILISLEKLHELGFVHRDLKPQNILFHDSKWKLADLGLISGNKDIFESTITATDAQGGTPRYCAPEQILDFKRATPAADIYSFGAILHDIFNGEPRTPYSKLSSSGPIGLIIEKCTEENPLKRFKSISALRNVVLSALAKQKAGTPTESIEQWTEKIKKIDSWEYKDFESFFFLLKKSENDFINILYEFDIELIKKLFDLDIELWENLADFYCNWINSKYFGFNYCDVLIENISQFYYQTDNVSIQSKIALTAISLGSRHNRWFVMHKAVTMCSPKISEPLAERIAIEIQIGEEDIKDDFISCHKRINYTKNVYHELISTHL